jgi:hypothetical protein
MSSDRHVDLLMLRGDPLERVIASYRADLSQVVYPYAGIWCEFILPKRLPENPSRVDEEWMPFAGSHYTAFIRLYHAFRSFKRLQENVAAIEGGQDSAEFLLDAHAETASFWEHIGSVIDNLGMCYIDAGIRVDTTDGKVIVAPHDSWLDWAYDRRSQFVHSRIVPKGVFDNDTVYFNLRYFDSKNGPWPPKYDAERVVSEYYKTVWKDFLTHIGNEWFTLYTRMQERIGSALDIRVIDLPPLDWGKVRPGEIRITGGPTPPSTIEIDEKYPGGDWFIPPSGTR